VKESKRIPPGKEHAATQLDLARELRAARAVLSKIATVLRYHRPITLELLGDLDYVRGCPRNWGGARSKLNRPKHSLVKKVRPGSIQIITD